MLGTACFLVAKLWSMEDSHFKIEGGRRWIRYQDCVHGSGNWLPWRLPLFLSFVVFVPDLRWNGARGHRAIGDLVMGRNVTIRLAACGDIKWNSSNLSIH